MDSSTPAPSLSSLVIWPAVITFAVSLVRFIGEIAGWNPTFFGTGAGGDASIVGITWLVAVFGLWFGLKLRRTNKGTRNLALSAVVYLVAIGLALGIGAILQGQDLLVFPSEESPDVEPKGLELIGVISTGAVIVGMFAWFRLSLTLLVYGLLARVPVILITLIAIAFDLETHYTALPAGVGPLEGMDLVMATCMPQLMLWVPFTVLAGGLFGCLGALLSGKGRVAPRT